MIPITIPKKYNPIGFSLRKTILSVVDNHSVNGYSTKNIRKLYWQPLREINTMRRELWWNAFHQIDDLYDIRLSYI